MNRTILSLTLLIIALGSILQAQVPRIINYQGLLLGKDEAPVAEGDYRITFNIYDETDNLLWSEVHSKVFIRGGLFHVLLGTISPLDIPFDQPYLLGLKLGDDTEMQPRMLLTSASYSLNAERVGGFGVNPKPIPNHLLPLDKSGKIPVDAMPVDSLTEHFLVKNSPDKTMGNTNTAMLLIENTGTGRGLSVTSAGAHGVYGKSTSGFAAIEGEGSGTGPGIRGSSVSNHGTVGYSTSPEKSGVYGNNAAGIGVTGNSQNMHGVYGQSNSGRGVKGVSPAGGVYGESTQGTGVEGRSNANDGVVGWSNNPMKSGVYGNSPFGNGVSGRSEAKDGILGVTTSSNAGHAGVHAVNAGSGPAVFSEGDLYVTGKSYGNIGPSGGAPFPKPAYNSGWIPITIEDPGYVLVKLDVDQYLPTSQYNNDNFVIDLMLKRSSIATNDLVGSNVDYRINPDNSISVFFGEYNKYHNITHFRLRVWYIK